MLLPIGDAAEMLGIETVALYVCDGGKECGRPSCLDLSRTELCHHTADPSHALYGDHPEGSFDLFPSVRGDSATVLKVERIRG